MTKSKFSGSRILVLGLAASVLATGSLAGKPTEVTDAEMAMLPPYCVDTMGFKYGDAYTNTSPNAPKWVALMGQGFWAMHHYCWALINIGRAQRPTMPANLRQGTRESAIGDMRYVIENTPPDFVMLPEIYTRIGEQQLALGRVSDARASFDKARSLKPDYWPPYFQWAEYLHRAGKTAEARAVTEEGLAYSPGAKPLQSLLVDLGGNPATVAPKTSASEPTAASPSQ
ncbi:MAG TPA: hypothetical protein VMN56_03770 [Casimicrobiaceae bacterium]|nr:hypothetical protein [Casimicrobiaceae bacterium]